MNENTRKKARNIQLLLAEHYEPGRQDRCKLWVFRNVIAKQYPMSERTFFRYIGIDASGNSKKEDDKRQLKLF